jgi:hypothetical protein
MERPVPRDAKDLLEIVDAALYTALHRLEDASPIEAA